MSRARDLADGTFSTDLSVISGASTYALIDSDGLKFNGDTAAANALDDYEEGTWTPSVTTGTVSTTFGAYTKVGRLVSIVGRVSVFSDTSSGNRVEITGLPFTVGGGDGNGSAFARYTSKSAQACYIPNGQAKVFFYGMAGGDWANQELDHADLQSSSADFYFAGTYYTS